MKYLDGEQVKVDHIVLKTMIGVHVVYLLERDIDKSGRGYFFPRTGVIAEITGKNVDFGNSDWVSMSEIKEIILL